MSVETERRSKAQSSLLGWNYVLGRHAALRTSIQFWIRLGRNFVTAYFKGRSGDPCHNGSCVVSFDSEGFTD